MSYRIIDHDDAQITVEFIRDGQTQRLNVNVARDIGAAINPVGPQSYTGPAPAGAGYSFKQGEILPPHKHDAKTLHDIEVTEGTVIVRKDSGDVTATLGDIIEIAEGETHSIIAITPARTIHWLKRQT